MGYLYSNNRLVCDICGTPGARKRACPHKWCQPIACCGSDECKRKLAKHRRDVCKTKCKTEGEAYDKRKQREREMLDSGLFVRCSAMSCKNGKVHVLFRDRDRKTTGFYMHEDTYRAFPLTLPVTPDDFASKGDVEDAPAEFAY